jgi:hypothetical protein
LVAAFVEHTVDDFMKYTPARLKAIRLDCRMCIEAAKQSIAEGDERGKRALAHYRQEMRQINLAYQAQVYGEDSPPEQTVELETIAMFGKAVQI